MRQLLTFESHVSRVNPKLGINRPKESFLKSYLIYRSQIKLKVCCRSMQRLRDIMYRGLTPNSRAYATWSCVYRKKEPIKMKTPPAMEIDEESGYKIMRSFDASGANHYVLCDKDYPSDKFVLVKGTFTSKPTPFNGVPPIFVSQTNLEGVPKNQYFHHYETPLLLRKADMLECTHLINMLSHKDYQALLKKISST